MISWVQRNWLTSLRYAFRSSVWFFKAILDFAHLLPREPLSQRQSHEFLRTAHLVEQIHWKLDRAAEYLRTLVSDSARGSADAWEVPVIRWIFEDAGARDSPLTVGDSSTLNPEVFDCTFAVTKPIPVHVRGGDLARPAAVRRVGRGKAKAKSLSRVSPRSEAVKGVQMGSVAPEPGQPDGGAVPRTRKHLATHIPESLEAEVEAEVAGGSPAKVDRESAEEGPCGRGPEVHVAEAVPQNSVDAKFAFHRMTQNGLADGF